MSSKLIKPKVVILAGGAGMRLREETEYKPKPMVQIGPYPILWHIIATSLIHPILMIRKEFSKSLVISAASAEETL